MTAVLSGEADIGFMGSESSIYTYQEGANDVIKNFAQLTQRAGNFLVAREEMPDFSWDDLKGKDVLGGVWDIAGINAERSNDITGIFRFKGSSARFKFDGIVCLPTGKCSSG